MTTDGFTKLFSSLITSSIWSEDDKTRIMWITLLAITDQDGFCNASLPGLAALARMSIQDAEKCLKKLESPDETSRTTDFEGRRIQRIEGGWCVNNYRKYRDKTRAEKRREYLRHKQREHRQRSKSLGNTLMSTKMSTMSTNVNKMSTNPSASASASASAITPPLKDKELPITGNRVYKVDYKTTPLLPITDYADLKTCNDLILAAVCVTGDREGAPHWINILSKARKKYGKERADRLFLGCVETTYGEMKQGECRKPGACLNLKLAQAFK